MEGFDQIKAGMSNERVVTIEEGHTTSRTGTPILSTPRMIAFMEAVSAETVDGLLPSGFTTVGYEVHVKHKAAAALGSKVTVSSKLLEADGKKLLFEVRAVEGEKLIGEGTHRRTIVLAMVK